MNGLIRTAIKRGRYSHLKRSELTKIGDFSQHAERKRNFKQWRQSIDCKQIIGSRTCSSVFEMIRAIISRGRNPMAKAVVKAKKAPAKKAPAKKPVAKKAAPRRKKAA
jgi:hypothetical protein